MKTTLTALAFALLSTAASADSFPRHQFDGFRDTGCNAASRVEVKSEDGERTLYWLMSCAPRSGNRSHDLAEEAAAKNDAPAS